MIKKPNPKGKQKKWKENPSGVDYPNTWIPVEDEPYKYEERRKAGLPPIKIRKARPF